VCSFGALRERDFNYYDKNDIFVNIGDDFHLH
jgi:hypothetical protein